MVDTLTLTLPPTCAAGLTNAALVCGASPEVATLVSVLVTTAITLALSHVRSRKATPVPPATPGRDKYARRRKRVRKARRTPYIDTPVSKDPQ